MLIDVKSEQQDVSERVPVASGFIRLIFAFLILFLSTHSHRIWADQVTPASPELQQREDFVRAWQAANLGQEEVVLQLKPGLQDYILFPYLQYDDLLQRKASVSDEEMASFLSSHEDWAFTAGLRRAWLRSLGERARWQSLIEYAGIPADAEAGCYLARARIETGLTADLLPVAQDLWAVGKSQPDNCDPVFAWLGEQEGITSDLAWERIRRAMEARETRLAQYLARFLDAGDQIWVDRWQEQDRQAYARLERSRRWKDQDKSRDIVSFGLRRLARNDPDRAWQIYESVQDHFLWSDEARNGVISEIALWSAVESVPDTSRRMRAVAEPYRDSRLLEWWLRFDLARENWAEVILTVASLPPELKSDGRWRYWDARARLQMGDPDYAYELLSGLALEANYYGFMSADYLDLPYTICPQDPSLDPAEIAALREQPGFRRALELRQAGIKNWSRSEWQMATRNLDNPELRLAAAIASEVNWPDMVIFALGKSGDLRWYEWRFPVEYAAPVERYARDLNLDPAWVMGLMRSESAMATDALSSAGARGLMQLMPETARQLAKRNAIPYTGPDQLLQPDENIRLGTAFLREMLDRFEGNPVLATGAYNAGPGAVNRWLKTQQATDPAIWIETLPFFETRDYIPRVLAFSTIYDWRLQLPVRRITSRMPAINSGNMGVNTPAPATAEVVCRASG